MLEHGREKGRPTAKAASTGDFARFVAILIDEWFAEMGSALAIVESSGAQCSFAELRDGVRKQVQAWRKKGLSAGSRVALRFPEGAWIGFARAYLATVRIGAVAVLVPDWVGPYEQIRLLDAIGCDAIVGGDGFEMTPEPAARRQAQRGARDLKTSALRAPRSRTVDIVYTSGSTGRPKAVAASQEATYATACRYAARRGEPKVLGHSASHTSAIGARSLLWASLTRGDCLVSWSPFIADAFGDVVARYGVNTLILPAISAPRMVKTFDSTVPTCPSLSSIRFVSGPISRNDYRALTRHLPRVDIVNVYGLTEAADAHIEIRDWDDAGRPIGVPARDTEVKIVDGSGEECPDGVVGSIAMRAPSPPLTYFLDPRETRRVWEHGWTISHDLGFMDSVSRVHLCGRKDGVAQIRGREVRLDDVTAILTAHPDVIDAATVALDEGNAGTLLVSLAESSTSVKELMAYVEARISAHAVPSRIIQVGKVPRAASGKVMASSLLALARKPCLDTLSTPTMGLVADIWRATLRLQPEQIIAADASFWALGGDSLAAVECCLEIEDRCGVALEIQSFFDSATLADLAGRIDGLRGEYDSQ